MSDIQRQVEERIEAFVSDLSALIRQSALNAVAAALGGASGVSARRGGDRPVARALRAGVSAVRKKGEKRSPQALARTTASLLDYIKKNSGQRIEQIGKAMKVATKDLSLPVKKLLKGKKISSRGHKRSTTYHSS